MNLPNRKIKTTFEFWKRIYSPSKIWFIVWFEYRLISVRIILVTFPTWPSSKAIVKPKNSFPNRRCCDITASFVPVNMQFLLVLLWKCYSFVVVGGNQFSEWQESHIVDKTIVTNWIELKEFNYEISKLKQSKIFTKNCHIINDTSDMIVTIKTIRNKDRSIKKPHSFSCFVSLRTLYHWLILSVFFPVIVMYQCNEKNFPR